MAFCYVLAFLSHLVTLTERRLLKNRSAMVTGSTIHSGIMM